MKPAALKVSVIIASLLALLTFPAIVFASVDITEVMYDAPGSDLGHEWIEVSNDGSSAVNLSGYKLFERGTNHGISVAAGTSTLAAGEAAILSDNPQTFLQDFPNYTGTLFKSSFSLSNTGETITLKDASVNPVSSMTYTSTLGANGDGNSLHLSGNAWIPGAPNPGSLAPTAPIAKAPAAVVVLNKSPASKLSASNTSTAPAYSSTAAAVNASAAPLQAPQSALPQGDSLWISLLGLAALVVIGVGGALYARTLKASAPAAQESTPTAEEFDLDD